MILGDVVDGPGGLHMFYVGFQRVARAKFLAFTGLAVSTDGGDHFRRVQGTPILDRAPGRSTIGAVHSAIHEDGRWRLRSEEHTSELQSLMRISYAVFCLKKKNKQ